MAVKVVRVQPGSIACELGIRPGHKLLRINGEDVRDYLDFLFLSSDGYLEVEVETEDGIYIFEVEREEEPLGIEVEQIKPKRCRCRCIFCFMDQMPKGLRPSLYLKDDDYRLSFLYGNYITLVGMKEEDYQRIGKQRLSPLYVSVHATDPEVRAFIMGNEEAAYIMDGLKRLCGMGIKVHAQIVVCPGINDGEVLRKTVMDLAELYPGVLSVAVVPVGLTKYRKGLYPLKGVGIKEAQKVLDIIVPMGEVFLKELGTRFVFPADEFFIKAGRPIPPLDFYEGLYQLEDGVGMIASFLAKLTSLNKDLPYTFVTGCAFTPFLREALKLAGARGFEVIAVENRFFGKSVDVAGLLVGEDIVSALRKNNGKKAFVISDVLLNEDRLTIDDMKPEAIEKLVGTRCVVVPFEPDGFWETVTFL